MPALSVVIPVFNNETTIGQCLAAVRASGMTEYELIVADCGSNDQTVEIARGYADRVLELAFGCGRNRARLAGFAAARHDIIVNIDSDVVVPPDTLGKIAAYFAAHEDVDAITGLLSKNHPNKDLCSQYKNLYMHYRFVRLPERVDFLYGSIFAFRRPLAELYDKEFPLAEDTAFGRNLVRNGKKISFLKIVEVTHLKKYGLSSLLVNDFLIALNLVKIFFKYRGWHSLFTAKKFAHSSMGQIFSLMLAAAIPVFFGLCWAGVIPVFFLWWAVLFWVLCNSSFFVFVNKEKGPVFVLAVLFLTFLTDLAKAFGVVSGATAQAVFETHRQSS